MEKSVSIPFVELSQEDRSYYAENHFIRFFIGSPRMFALIYSRDLGFTRNPLPGFKPLSPFLDASELALKIKENIYSLESEFQENHPVRSLSVKDTLKYILSVIAGFGYHSKPPRLKIEKRSAELSNAYNYVKKILRLKPVGPIKVSRQVWLNLRIFIVNNGIRCMITNEYNRENNYRVLEILAKENSELAEYILKM
jgi:hypothetical protein